MTEQAGRGNPELFDRVLDAAEASFDRHGVGNESIEEIARLAGVSRGLVYKRFQNRDGLILAVLVRRANRFNQRASVFIGSQPTLADSLVEGLLLSVRLAHRDPYFGKLVGSAIDASNRIKGAPEAAARLIDELWRPILERGEAAGELRAGVDLEDVIQWILCLTLMLLGGRSAYDVDEATQARQLRTLFLPAVLRDLAELTTP